MFAFLIVTAHFSTITQDYNIAFFQKKSRGLVNHGLIFFVELATLFKKFFFSGKMAHFFGFFAFLTQKPDCE